MTLTIERQIVGHKNRPTFGMLVQPICKCFHDRLRNVESQMLLSRKATHSQSPRDEPV